jgi:hypothetical protein
MSGPAMDGGSRAQSHLLVRLKRWRLLQGCMLGKQAGGGPPQVPQGVPPPLKKFACGPIGRIKIRLHPLGAESGPAIAPAQLLRNAAPSLLGCSNARTLPPVHTSATRAHPLAGRRHQETSALL